MAKNIVLCFDGTCNEPRDADQQHSLFGGIEDDNITNVLKLHLLLGGDLRDGSCFDDQTSLYYSGVGTHGSKVKRIFNAAFAPDHLDVGRIIRAGAEDLRARHQDGDKVFVFGFSRGAAIARRFASVLPEFFDGLAPRIRFLGVFDTVASIGAPNLDDSEKPVSDVVFENQTISPLIDEALHLVALDERRKAFMPTLMNREERITEIWLPGAHADIGGGYRQDGLSDLALDYLLQEMERRGLGVRVRSPAEIDYRALVPEDADYTIDFDDVMIQPDFFGVNHEQRRPRLSSRITLAPRFLRVNVGDQPSDEPPLVHHAVADRVYGDHEYRPEALRLRTHRIVYADRETETFEGLAEHLRRGHRRLVLLEGGTPREVPVHANLKYNRSGIFLEKGRKYAFDVDLQQEWRDGPIPCGPDGWDRDDINYGIKEIFIQASEPFRRFPRARWFELIGSIGDRDDELFQVLKHTSADHPYVPRRSGELCAFANDLSGRYGNNMGTIWFTVRRVE